MSHITYPNELTEQATVVVSVLTKVFASFAYTSKTIKDVSVICEYPDKTTGVKLFRLDDGSTGITFIDEFRVKRSVRINTLASTALQLGLLELDKKENGTTSTYSISESPSE